MLNNVATGKREKPSERAVTESRRGSRPAAVNSSARAAPFLIGGTTLLSRRRQRENDLAKPAKVSTLIKWWCATHVVVVVVVVPLQSALGQLLRLLHVVGHLLALLRLPRGDAHQNRGQDRRQQRHRRHLRTPRCATTLSPRSACECVGRPLCKTWRCCGRAYPARRSQPCRRVVAGVPRGRGRGPRRQPPRELTCLEGMASGARTALLLCSAAEESMVPRLRAVAVLRGARRSSGRSQGRAASEPPPPRPPRLRAPAPPPRGDTHFNLVDSMETASIHRCFVAPPLHLPGTAA